MHTGIDLGLKTTAIVTLDNDGHVLYEKQFGSEVNSGLKAGNQIAPPDRWRFYYDYFFHHIGTLPVPVGTIAIEEPMNLQGMAIKLVELKALAILASSYFTPSTKIFFPKPTQIKKSFIGSGAATKEQMIARCNELGYFPTNHNLADAYAVAYMSVNGDLKYLKWS